MRASNIGTLELDFIDVLVERLVDWDKGITVGK